MVMSMIGFETGFVVGSFLVLSLRGIRTARKLGEA